MPLTAIADKLGISLPTVSVAVQRGAQIVDVKSWISCEASNIKYKGRPPFSLKL